MTSPLLMLGAGGHGRVVADAAHATGAWISIEFFDDEASCGVQLAGDSTRFFALSREGAPCFIAIGDVDNRMSWLDRVQCTTIVHPTAIISPSAVIGAGTFVGPGAIINAGTRIGRGCIINSGAIVEHDCEIGDGVHICPGVSMAGNVMVGTRSWVGVGSSVKHGTVIGSGVTVGAGAAVVKHIADGLTVIGVPAKPLRA